MRSSTQMSLRLFAPPEPILLAKRATLEELVASAKGYAAEVRATSTRRAYLTDFRSFEAWCQGRDLSPLPATSATVAIYVAALADAGRRPSTIQRALAGIAFAHRAQGQLWPGGGGAVGQVMTGIRRRYGTAPEQKAPIEDGELGLLVATLGEGLVGLRDRALLTLGWMGAFRRSELVALRVQDVTRTREGLVVRLERSKNDQEGRGGATGIPRAADPSLCPVAALTTWLEAAGITSGALFRGVDRLGRVRPAALSDRSVARIVQRAAAAAGLDPATVAGHSLRAGFVTTAARNGKSVDAIMRQTHHRTERMVRSYIRHRGMFDDNAGVGLL